MFELHRLGTAATTIPPRGLFVGVVDELADWPDDAPTEGPFVVLTVLEARSEPEAALRRLARTLLRQGCLWACAWGPACERVHDAFDLELIAAEEAGRPFDEDVTTTWHDDETLREALWFAVYNTDHPERDLASVVVVARPADVDELRKALTDPERLWEGV